MLSLLWENNHLRTLLYFEHHTHQFGFVSVTCKNSAILGQCFIAGLISVPLPGNAALRPRRSLSSNQGKEAEVRKDIKHGKKYRRGTCLNWETCCFYGIPSFWKSSLKPSKHRRVVLEAHFWKIFESSSVCVILLCLFPSTGGSEVPGTDGGCFVLHTQTKYLAQVRRNLIFFVWQAPVLCSVGLAVLRGRDRDFYYSKRRRRG